MDVLSVSDKATGDKIDNHGGSCCKNEAIDPRSGLNLQLKESSFWRHDMELYHHRHHHARHGALGYYYYPFTNAQLKELERQAMIYKYMMASIPIPFDLLVSSSASPYDGRNVKFGLKGGDSEPGRCRRTDGKKWRCSKDVVPQHKYCERHLHRGRPRSRKPVETTSSTSQHLSYGRRINKNSNSNSCSEKKDGSSDPLAASMLYSYRGDPRSFHWEMLKGDIFPVAAPTEQQPNGRAASMLSANYNNLSCSGTERQDNHYLNFIDVWSNGASIPDEHGSNPVCKTSGSAHGNLSISSLDLSMGGNNKLVDDELGSIDIGLGSVGSCQDPAGCCITSSEMSSWLAPAASATPGGPLAEILRPSPVATPSAEHPPSPNLGDGGSHGLKFTTPSSSSSSGVMNKTTASLSGGSQS